MDFRPPDMAAKRRELELQEDLPDGTMVFPEFTLPTFPGTSFQQVVCNGVPCEVNVPHFACLTCVPTTDTVPMPVCHTTQWIHTP
eukprot:COSAG05_NODE_24121_length_253_cov_1.409091_1_plen_84_part_11